MKTNILSLLAIAGLLSFSGCANDDTTNKEEQQELGTEGLTSFVEEDNATRTTGEYDGSGLNFYWTEGDRLWVHNTAATPALRQDAQNNISDLLVANPTTPTGVKRAAKASFSFQGTYTASSYPVRYTGKGNANGDKVTIKAAQSQTIPNDASHIGEDGDCGVATATKPAGSNKYHFTLGHEASYATFLPYNSNGLVADFVIQKITLIADQALCGTFDFNDSGIDTGSRPAPTATNKVVELTLNNFAIPATATPATNAATAVIAPGSYTNFTVVYTLHNPITNQTGTVTKQYPGTVTFTKGKNKKISQDLPPTYSADGYYMWDAKQNYWYSHLDANGQPDGNYPQNKTSDPDRWYNEVPGYSDPTGAAPAVTASNTAAGCPNVNEILWYMKGDPHYDDAELWAFMGHLYTGSMWFKKKEHISGYSANKAPDGINYPRYTADYASGATYGPGIIQSRPAASDLNNYFNLPMLGQYFNGKLLSLGTTGLYWSNTPIYAPSRNVYAIEFTKDYIYLVSSTRNTSAQGFRLWTAQ